MEALKWSEKGLRSDWHFVTIIPYFPETGGHSRQQVDFAQNYIGKGFTS
jgi:hypothetical protein